MSEQQQTTEDVLVERDGAVAIVTLNRPGARNALNSSLRRALYATIRDLDDDEAIRAIVLTGADPAFCAGLDLRELAGGGQGVAGSDTADATTTAERESLRAPVRFFPVVDTPIIGAINGAAITGGFEVALQCTFLIASERAVFADTHARVGILPGAGLTAYLTEAVGVRRALEASLTGNFIGADEALERGLVNRVVPHEDLLATARSLAHDIAGNDPGAVRALVAHYRRLLDEGSQQRRFDLEAELHHGFGGMNNPAERVDGVIERGRAQQRSTLD